VIAFAAACSAVMRVARWQANSHVRYGMKTMGTRMRSPAAALAKSMARVEATKAMLCSKGMANPK